MESGLKKRSAFKANCRILIIEDDVALTSFLRRQLESEGYTVTLVHDGNDAGQAFADNGFDLVVLDLNLPDKDGLTLLRELRATTPAVPVLILTGRSSVEDRVLSLDNGADDYLLKPFSVAEFAARIRALLRRHQGTTEQVSKVGDLVLSRSDFRVERAGARIDLTIREFAVLEYLMRSAGRPVGRAELMDKVWNQPFDPTTNLVDVYVKYVRDKVDSGQSKKLIRTVRGLGYMVSDE